MNKILILLPILLFILSCQSIQKSSRIPASEAEQQANAVTVYINPCFQSKGMPYNKYYGFSLDPNHQIYKYKCATCAGLAEENGIYESIILFVTEKKICPDKEWTQTAVITAQTHTPTTPVQPTIKPPKENDDETPDNGSYLPIKPVTLQKYFYYGVTSDSEFNNNFQNQLNEKKEDLRSFLHHVLTSVHQQKVDQPDQILDSCPENKESSICLKHYVYSYGEARRQMFGYLDLEKNESDSYFLTDVYCRQKITVDAFKPDDIKKKFVPGPYQIPNANVVNAEHTWPQSRFNLEANLTSQKTDLHHLFTTNSRANNLRGNFQFAEVGEETKKMPCEGIKFGKAKPISEGNQQDDTSYFEPPKSHKGNVARALFYFAVKYNTHINPTEEYYLRKWNQEDPVDEWELRRHEMIYEIMGSRNPFVDYPELVNAIGDF